MILLLPGGFYSDTLGYVAESCKECPNGSYVAYDKKPGKSVLDCKSCPLGKQLKHDPQVLILKMYKKSREAFYLRRN